MTGFEIEQRAFGEREVLLLAQEGGRFANWPVVYTLGDERRVYVGETLQAAARMQQHLRNDARAALTGMRIILDDTFNKSVCLDLESFLIQMFAGDQKYEVLNRNIGVVDSDYYRRADYQPKFDEVFEALRARGAFERSRPEIVNSEMYKLSPFKSLNADQAAAVNDIVETLLASLAQGAESEFVVRGEPGTGKTVVAVYLLKLLSDIAAWAPGEEVEADAVHAEFFTAAARAALTGLTVGFVIPQQSLRSSVRSVFRKTPGLAAEMVLSPFDVGEADRVYDLLVVDETHRLGQRANQASGPANKRFADITARLFGADDRSKTQLDWIRARSRHRLLLLDEHQSVKPADLSPADVAKLLRTARDSGRLLRLRTQMRLEAAGEYVDYVRSVLSGEDCAPRDFGRYDLRFFDSLPAMAAAIDAREREHSLARLVAGFAWPWRSKTQRTAIDIEEPGFRRQWNQTPVDWIGSPTSSGEVGSIHTVQGYDLNYAGVIIGRDIRLDPASGRVYFSRRDYFDKKGKENNRQLGITYSDEDLLRYVINIYAVLMSRGILGTYVYVCDEPLRERLRAYFPPAPNSPGRSGPCP
ncbi:DUF2075 domain-containing protein [Brevibacterium sp. 5221]|uniref:DUF2075 domain-containing protein n=1 Tax=Brevibacterium rongguiense TaxID=2695267 RepID=A0A6N9H7J7_9MICO|nr:MULTISPECIES: DUF2075 domain-containing protein [Brevibacterium]MYM20048.1 DUF2075 domain-containing protein [Brevibacterium rongguiense]WAL40919.1 DUF2075 domain-containing protein [Brevibacterium sp. BRM-1]